VTQKNKETQTTIFIHSLFRTGSTYFWNKFRERKQFCCYYEPFHQGISMMSMQNPAPWSHDRNTTRAMGHPHLEKDYMFEYRELLRPNRAGVPYFKKAFSFDNFCATGQNPKQKKYIDFLIKHSGDKIPLFQFNRSSLRIRWFKKYYPGGLHIYMIRNPHDQFDSYLMMHQEKNLDIFLTMDLIVSGVNRQVPPFDKLAAHVPLFEYHSDDFKDEEVVYRCLLPIYTLEEKYFIFYYIWFAALVENLLNADLIASIDLVSSSEKYRKEMALEFKKRQVGDVDFGDARIRKRTADVMDEETMTNIQDTVQSIILKEYSSQDIKNMMQVFGPEEKEYFNLDRTRLETLRETELPIVDIKQKFDLKYKQAFEHFTGVLIHQNTDIVAQKNGLRGKQIKILQLEQKLEEQYGTRGNLTEPLIQSANAPTDNESELKTKKLLLNKDESEVYRLKEQLVEKEKQLELKEQLLRDEKTQFERLGQQLEDKQKRLKQTEIRLEDVERQIEQLEQKLEQKQELLVQNEKKLLLDEEQIEQLEQQRKWIKRQLQRKNELIEKNAQFLEQKSLQLQQNETQIQQLKLLQAQNDKILQNKKMRITELTQRVEQLEQMNKKEKENKELILKQLNDEKNELKKKEIKLEQADDKLAGYKQELEEIIERLNLINRLLADSNQRVTTLESLVVQKNEHIRRIYCSKTHKAGKVVIYPFRLGKRILTKFGGVSKTKKK
jgi:hypothetical protein